MFIKFIGDWKRLIPMGYQFNRMFARNYIAYCKGKTDNRIWIWKALKDVQIIDLNYSNSALILKHFIDSEFALPRHFSTLVINNETHTVEEFDFDKHDAIHVLKWKDGIRYEDIPDEEIIAFHDKFTKIHLIQDVIDILKELYESGMIQIVEGKPGEEVTEDSERKGIYV